LGQKHTEAFGFERIRSEGFIHSRQ
jgi:hypothetical protein